MTTKTTTSIERISAALGGSQSDFENNRLRDLAAEAARRKVESLRLYEPMPHQEALHAATASQVIMRKGNRVGGPQRLDAKILTPNGWTTMGALKVGDTILGGDGKPCTVLKVFEQGWLPVFRVTFDDGASTVCSEDHFWRCQLKKSERFGKGCGEKWGVYSLREIREHGGDDPVPRERAAIPVACAEFPETPVPVPPYTLGVILGDGCISSGAAISFTTEDAEIADFVRAELPADVQVVRRESSRDDGKASMYAITKVAGLANNSIMAALRELSLMGTRSESKSIPREYMQNSVETRLSILQGLMDTDGTADQNGNCFFYSCSPQLCEDVMNLVRSLGGKSHLKWKETFITKRTKKIGAPCKREYDHEADDIRRRCLNMGIVWLKLPKGMRPFRLPRKLARLERLKHAFTPNRLLVSIRPEGNAICRCIEVSSPDHTYITDDYIVTHNSLAGAVELARAVTGCDPYEKYPKENGTAVCLGYGEGHIGRVFYKLLFKSGAFDIIRDKETRQWRAFRPWPQEEGGDLGREAERMPAPPLIPRRFIKDKIAWVKKSERIFSKVYFTTGWELYAFNSNGDPSQAQGFDCNLAWIDEDIAQAGWMEELGGRMARVHGKLRWTALPHGDNDEMMKLVEEAERCAEEGVENPETVLIQASILDNKYIEAASRDKSIAAWKAAGEEVYKQRVYGLLQLDSFKMYPTFNRVVHSAINHESTASPVQRIITERDGEPPDDWTRYMIVDPGHQVCAVLFIAVPPPIIDGQPIPQQAVVYDECYIKNATARLFGDAIEPKVREKVFQRFVMDFHGASLTEIGSGVTPLERYQEELKIRGLRCEATGSTFSPGVDDVKSREESLRIMLGMDRDGYPGILIVMDRCPNLRWEIERFKKKTLRRGGDPLPLDEGDRRANTHAVECLEYFAAGNYGYVKPRRKALSSDPIGRFQAWLTERRERIAARGQSSDKSFISLGPNGSSS